MLTNDKLLFLLAICKAKNPSIANGAYTKNVELGWDYHLSQMKRQRTTCAMWDWDAHLECWHIMVNVKHFPEDMWPDVMANSVQGCVGFPTKPITRSMQLPKGFTKDLSTIDMRNLIDVLRNAEAAEWSTDDDLSNHLPVIWMRSNSHVFKGLSDLRISKKGLEMILKDLNPEGFAAKTGMLLRKTRQLA